MAPKNELDVIAYWRKQAVFRKSIESRKGADLFVTNDGPPFATGLPHYGHLLASTIKDTILRYKTMQGFCVPRRFGWDCHGLPVENEVIKEKNLSDPSALEKFGMAKFNESCRSIVMRYSEEWKSRIERLGRWVDFTENYRTMDIQYMESVWWTLKQLFKKGYVYDGVKVMPFSPALGTTLSNFEASLNYKEVDDPSVTVKFPLRGGGALLVWTTTPWTLPVNMALAVGPGIMYVRVRYQGAELIVAKERVEAVFDEAPQVLEEMLGKDLVGKEYEPPFSDFAFERKNGAFRIIGADFVTTGDGTGIVHISPAHGEDDFYAAKEAGVPLVCAVDDNGRFTKLVPELEGLFFKEADKAILAKLKEEGLLFKRATCRHRYPFCWRTDTPLMYKAHATWFVAVEKFKDLIIDTVKDIHWVPSHIKEGRFGKWLEGARDWAISRNRFWGTPIPIWRSASGKVIVIGSKKELEERTGSKVDDLHRHFIDHLEIVEEGEVYKRVPEIFDCWFESGSAPWAQWHYPFSSIDYAEKRLPADFIAEGLDQTRCWFYTMSVLSAGVFGKGAFKNVIVNGILLAEDGAKMSKSLRNFPDPMEVIETLGADSLRLYLLASPATYGDDLRFCERGVQTIARQVILPLKNALHFYQTYAKIYTIEPKAGEEGRTLLDRWILSRAESLAQRIESSLDQYVLADGVNDLIAFVDELTNWYIRRSRSRFWTEKESPERSSAFATLKRVLGIVAGAAAPFIPFLTEQIWLGLEMGESVHLSDFPKERSHIDEALEKEMAAVQKITGLGHSLRKEQKIKVRQPLARAWVIGEGIEAYLDLIADELNVKKVEMAKNASEFVDISMRPNFRILGKKVGSKMRAVAAEIAKLELSERVIVIDGETMELLDEDIEIIQSAKGDRIAKAEGDLCVAFDTELSDALILEGYAREIINKVNTMRREAGFEVTDRIHVTMDADSAVKDAFDAYRDYIMHEVLATGVEFAENHGATWDLGGVSATIAIRKTAHV